MIIAISGRIGSGKDLVGSIIQYLVTANKFETVGEHIKGVANTKEDFLNHTEHYKHRVSGWQIKKFADKLKNIVCLLTGCTREQLEDQEFKNKELGKEWDGMEHGDIPHGDIETYRQLLQYLGTDLFRSNLHENVWVNSLMSEYKLQIGKYDNVAIQDSYPNWIITDMRFPNELKAVKDRKGITIRVTRNIEFNLNDYETAYEYGKNILKEKYGIETSEYPDEVSIKDDSNLYTKDGLKEEYCKEFNDLVNSYVKPVSKEHESETALDDATFDYEIDNSSTIKELIEKVREILIKEKLVW